MNNIIPPVQPQPPERRGGLVPTEWFLGMSEVANINKLAAEGFREKATYDDLTHLLKPGAFRQKVDARIEQAQAGQPSDTGLLFSDLDKFKAINDTIGHEAGDELLVTFADKLKTNLRESDEVSHIGRPGGDEIAILCDLTPRTDTSLPARERLDHIKDRVINTFEIAVDSHSSSASLRKLGVGISAGGSIWEEGMTTSELYSAADHEMRIAKRERKKQTLTPDEMDTLTAVRPLLDKAGIRVDFLDL